MKSSAPKRTPCTVRTVALRAGSMVGRALIVVSWSKARNGLEFPARAFAILP